MFDLFGAEMPLAVRFFLAFLIVLGLIGAAAWAVRTRQRAPQRRGARTAAATCGHRIRNGRRAPAPAASAARQCRTSDDDRRTDRRGRGSQYRARRACCGARAGGAAHSCAGRKPGARYSLAGDVEWLLAAAAGSSHHAGATSCAGAPGTAHRADARGADQRRAAACRTDSSPATRGVDRARRRSFRCGCSDCAGHAAAAAQPARAAHPLAALRTTERTSR